MIVSEVGRTMSGSFQLLAPAVRHDRRFRREPLDVGRLRASKNFPE